MKLIEAHIEGFGRLSNRRLNMDAPVIVVYGPNEAGKSTLFGFLRTMLYGFARRSSLVERGEPVHGGRHGGRLILESEAGARYMLLRHADEAGGKPRVRKLSGESAAGVSHALQELVMEQKLWENEFLGGVHERLYKGLFAITLTELQEVSLLSGSELGRHLYQAGWEGGAAIAAAEKEIAREMDALFKARGSSQRMNASIKALEQADAELKKIADSIESYNSLKSQEGETEQAIAEIAARLPGVQEELRALRKASLLRSSWLRRKLLAAEREKLLYTEKLAPGAEQAWEELQRSRAEAEERSHQLKQEIELLDRQRSGLHYHPELLSKAARTEAALQSAERMRTMQLQLAEWETELHSLDASIGHQVTSISPEWTERQLRELTVTLADRDYVREAREREQAFRRSAERLDGELATLRIQERELESQLNEAELACRNAQKQAAESGNGRFGIKPLSKSAVAAAWDALDESLRELELEQAQNSNRAIGNDAEPKSSKGLLYPAFASAGAAVALSAAAAGGWLGQAGDMAIIAAIALGGASAGLFVRTLWLGREAEERHNRSASGRIGRTKPRSGGSNAEASVQEAMSSLVTDSSAYGESDWQRILYRTSGNGPSALRAAVRQEVQERLEALTECDKAEQKRLECDSRLQRHRQSLDQRAAAVKELRREEEASTAEWRAWLQQRALPSSMSPAAALEAFELAESALERLGQFDKLSAKAAAARKELSEYADEAAKLCEGWDEAERLLREDAVYALQTLNAEIKRHAAVAEQFQAIRIRQEQAKLELSDFEREREQLEQALNKMLTESGLTTEPEYAAALQDRKALEQLDGELLKLDIELSAGSSEQERQEVDRLLHHLDEQELADRLQQLTSEESRLAQLQQELLERRGALRGALESLLQEDERQRLLAGREMIAASLDADMERYAVLTISKALIDQTKRVYEEERQPVVLRNASGYINRLTNGRYIRVSASTTDPDIRVEDAQQTVLSSGFLSRGTAEQLYLAMRLALAKESSNGVKLPLLLDDLFVNFDGNRLQAAAELMAELSEERQIIFFTCHERTRDSLLAACNGANLVDLASPSEAAVSDFLANH